MSGVTARVEEVPVETPGRVDPALLQGGQPRVLRGLLAEWPLVSAGLGGAAEAVDYLARFAREQPVVAFRGHPGAGGRYFYNEDLSGFNFDRLEAPLGQLLAEFRKADSEQAETPLYLGSTAVRQYFPGLVDENALALEVDNPLVSIWMGSQTRIAAHFDYPDNIAAVVAGRRRFLLFPPEQIDNLYVGPVDFTPAGQAISLVDSENPDFERFPRYREALARAQVAELEPGDALFIPSLWWHQVEGLDAFNVLVNYWWRSVPAAQGNPMDALIHCLMAFNGLPDGQREAWRSIFDYYLFGRGPDGAPHEHIPENRRGILGDIDEATAAQLRSLLRRKLGG